MVQPDNAALEEEIDGLLSGYREDGSLKALTEKWVGKALDLDALLQ